MIDPQKAKAEALDRILSAAEHALAVVQDLVVIGSKIVRSDEAALGEYESRLGALARRVVEARL
jgi:hypothetical protein